MVNEEFRYLCKGIYTISETAKLTGVTWARVRHWIRGDLRNPEGVRTPVPPIVETEYDKPDSIYVLSFLDLIEIMMIDKFRRWGVSVRAIRRAHESAKDIFSSTHPFAIQKFWTDRRDILTYVGNETRDKVLINLRKDQYELREITKMFIKKIDISKEGISLRWWPMDHSRHVVLDPERSFGQPIVADEGVPTIILANAVKAERSIERVSMWYNVDLEAVKSAYKYETEYTKRLAA